MAKTPQHDKRKKAAIKTAAASDIVNADVRKQEDDDELSESLRGVGNLLLETDFFGDDDLLARAARRLAKPTYRTSPTKSGRRTKADMRAIKDAIYDLVAKYRPMTVRQVYYQLVTKDVIEKTEGEYKSTVCRLLVEMRREGELPYGWIADNTRWMRKPDSYSSMDAMLANCQRTYRRAIWEAQDAYVEVWLEKEALAGVLVDVTEKWDVPLMVTRGYPSISFLHAAGEQIAAKDCPVYLYYFGDHDPSGVDIDRVVERDLREYAPNGDLTFERVAILEEHITQLNLPTRPTKKSDSRSKSFKGQSVEVDAIDPETLREMCEECITQHIDDRLLERTQAVEAAERETLTAMISGTNAGPTA